MMRGKRFPEIFLMLSCAVWCVIATDSKSDDAPFSIGLGVLAPSYSQKVGADGNQVKLDFNQDKNGYSYSVSTIGGPKTDPKPYSPAQQQNLGGHTLQHTAHAAHIDPQQGGGAVQHAHHNFHINPYRGEAALYTNNAAGHLDPNRQQAGYQQHTYGAQLAPGHTSYRDTTATATVSPFGNTATHQLYASQANAQPDGISHSTYGSQAGHYNAPGLGGVTQENVAEQRGFQGPYYGAVNQANQNTQAAYDPYGGGALNQQGQAQHGFYDGLAGYGAQGQQAYGTNAAYDPYGNYGSVTQGNFAARATRLVPRFSSYFQSGVRAPGQGDSQQDGQSQGY